jgi:hypothetical protein
MNFIELEDIHGDLVAINMDMVSEIRSISETHTEVARTRIFFNYTIYDNYVYTDVVASMDAILSKIRRKP